jgi:hypothetical protein
MVRLTFKKIVNVLDKEFPSIKELPEYAKIQNIVIYFYEKGYKDGVIQPKLDSYNAIPVKARTNDMHKFLIQQKYHGSVREYLLSMDEFLEKEIHDVPETEKIPEPCSKCKECNGLFEVWYGAHSSLEYCECQYGQYLKNKNSPSDICEDAWTEIFKDDSPDVNDR